MRNEFIQNLITYRKSNIPISLIVGDLGYSVVEPFANMFPESFFNSGVAEQNMAGLAAGMASEGETVFTYSICNFPTFRCAEQIRNDIDYNSLPVITTSVGSGVGYGSLGYSHHAIQDIGLMRLFPNTVISCPGDIVDLDIAMKYFCHHSHPGYLRLPKATPKLTLENNGDFSKAFNPGQVLKRRSGKSEHKAVISIGSTLMQAYEYAVLVDADLYTVPIWNSKNRVGIVEQLLSYDEVYIYEDHLLSGGFGSYLMESYALSGYKMPKFTFFCFDEQIIGSVGSENFLNNKFLKKIR